MNKFCIKMIAFIAVMFPVTYQVQGDIGKTIAIGLAICLIYSFRKDAFPKKR